MQYFLTCTKQYLVLKTNFRYFWEWLFYTGFTEYNFEAGMIRSFLAVPRIGLQYVVVAFSGRARLRYWGPYKSSFDDIDFFSPGVKWLIEF